MVNRTKFEKVRLLAFGFLVVVCLFPADGFAQGFLPHMSESSPVKPENLTQQQKAALPNRVLTGQGTVGESPAPSAEPIPAHAPPEPKPEASRIEKILSGEFPTEISRQLRQFGYDFFQRDTTAFEPVTAIPVGDDYVIGPRDEFTIYLWGKVEAAYPVTVTREGSILVPRLGSINVADGIVSVLFLNHPVHFQGAGRLGNEDSSKGRPGCDGTGVCHWAELAYGGVGPGFGNHRRNRGGFPGGGGFPDRTDFIA
jgi:hypothetical protein